MHRLCLTLLFSLLSFSAVHASTEPIYLTVGDDAYSFLAEKFGERLTLEEKGLGANLVTIDEQAVPWISLLMHQEFKRCGGFFWHENYESAQETLHGLPLVKQLEKARFVDYTINKRAEVEALMAQTEGARINQFIAELSEFHNRYYTSESGVEATEHIARRWRELTAHRNDVEVELYTHAGWPQKSVIMTIQGRSDEMVIVGGHADSTAGFFSPQRSRAPGADDNASGIATITEVVRVLMESSYQPEKTFVFMAYAAEEVGLRGSQQIAQQYAEEVRPVVGVLQLDMTNFPGSSYDLVLINDFTNAEQNAFVGGLIDEYLPHLTWTYERCGYACSDHASWTRSGFPASFPFEAANRERNPHIHTARDTLEQLSRGGVHADHFAKLALAYLIEMD